MAYRTTKLLSTATATATATTTSTRAQNVPRTGNYVSDMAALEIGASFQKLDSCSDWEPTRLPYLQSQNFDSSKYMPAVPERAYVSGWVPYPPSLPRCRTLDAVRSPTVVAHSTSNLCGVGTVVGPQNATHQIPSSPLVNLINLEEGNNEQPVVLPTPCVGLGLSLVDLGTIMDNPTASTNAVQHVPLEVNVSLLESSSGNKLSNHMSLDPVPIPLQLPSPVATPILSTSLSTPAPPKRRLDGKPKPKPSSISHLASPPETPTLHVTPPSVHYEASSFTDQVVDQDADYELESWSDVLGFQEYEEDELLSERSFIRLLNDFPSPAETPTRCPILDVPKVMSAPCDNDSESCRGDEGVTDPQAPAEGDERDIEDKVEDAPFDYAAFRERLAVFLKDMKDMNDKGTHEVPRLPLEEMNKNTVVSFTDLTTSSSSTQVDYGKLRARKRSPTLLNNQSAPPPQVSPLRIAPRPLPLPVEFQPLLGRNVERSNRQVPP